MFFGKIEMKNKNITHIILLATLSLLLAASPVFAELYIVMKIQKPKETPEVGFIQMKGKSPSQCVEKIKEIRKSMSQEQPGINAAEAKILSNADMKCSETHIIFDEMKDKKDFVYLVRYFAGKVVVTEMESFTGCENSRSLYSGLSGRESFCAESSQKILYQ